MLRRAFMLLLGNLALAGCAGYGGPAGGPQTGPMSLGAGAGGGGNQRIAILLPLTGPRAELGQSMLQAAQLALASPGSPQLDPKDTGGTPQGAAAAAQAAVAGGDRLILGPLTSGETAAVAPIARNADIAVLAFTNDPAQAQPGVWTLGITPGQQVRRLIAAAQGQGKTQLAALLPDNDLGRAMAQALNQAVTAAGLAPPAIRMHSTGMASINAAAKDLSDYANRRGPIEAKIKQARELHTAEGRRQAAELAKTPIPPPNFNGLLLADTGEALGEVAALLPYYDVDRSAVQLMGPNIWASPSSGSGQVPGAWYAAPDPASRTEFEQSFMGHYNTAPPGVADLAYDAASIARVLSANGGYSVSALTQQAGYTGVDGWFALLPDGEVRRGLALFQVERGGGQMIEPAPQFAGASGT